ncbi:MAG TPA: hypothetical protein VMX54_20665 [Vicinamibacteria bacterium]|nr:hypothetical protein [Vicinamibacteria bacterium]
MSQAGVLGEVLPRLPPGWTRAASPYVSHLYSLVAGGPSPSRGPRRLDLAYAGAARIARTGVREEALRALQRDLAAHVAEWSTRRVFVHAAVVGWQGRAVVVPGRDPEGNRRLVDALAGAGAVVYSDLYAAIDGRGRVTPFAGGTGGRPLPIGLLADVPFRTGRRWRAIPASRGQGVLAMMRSAVLVRTPPARALVALTRALRCARVVRGVRGEPEEAAGRLLQLQRQR